MVNFGDDVLKYLTKCISVKLCPAVTGQTAMECVINPPREGEPSYQLHQQVCVYVTLSGVFACSARHSMRPQTSVFVFLNVIYLEITVIL